MYRLVYIFDGQTGSIMFDIMLKMTWGTYME